MSKMIECAGCGKSLKDSYGARSVVSMGPTEEFKLCPGRGGYNGNEPQPMKSCLMKLVDKRRHVCPGCGEEKYKVMLGRVCEDCQQALERAKVAAEERKVMWAGIDEHFFTGPFWNEKLGLEASTLLARAVKGAGRLADRPDDSSVNVGGISDRESRPRVYVEVDHEQLEALKQLSAVAHTVADAAQREGVKKGSSILGRLASGDVKPGDFDAWQAQHGPESRFRSRLREFRERGLDDELLEKEFDLSHGDLHYWRRGENAPSLVTQERILAFLDREIDALQARNTEISK